MMILKIENNQPILGPKGKYICIPLTRIHSQMLKRYSVILLKTTHVR